MAAKVSMCLGRLDTGRPDIKIWPMQLWMGLRRLKLAESGVGSSIMDLRGGVESRHALSPLVFLICRECGFIQ
jgi:hypothetical protein